MEQVFLGHLDDFLTWSFLTGDCAVEMLYLAGVSKYAAVSKSVDSSKRAPVSSYVLSPPWLLFWNTVYSQPVKWHMWSPLNKRGNMFEVDQIKCKQAHIPWLLLSNKTTHLFIAKVGWVTLHLPETRSLRRTMRKTSDKLQVIWQNTWPILQNEGFQTKKAKQL